MLLCRCCSTILKSHKATKNYDNDPVCTVHSNEWRRVRVRPVRETIDYAISGPQLLTSDPPSLRQENNKNCVNLCFCTDKSCSADLRTFGSLYLRFVQEVRVAESKRCLSGGRPKDTKLVTELSYNTFVEYRSGC